MVDDTTVHSLRRLVLSSPYVLLLFTHDAGVAVSTCLWYCCSSCPTFKNSTSACLQFSKLGLSSSTSRRTYMRRNACNNRDSSPSRSQPSAFSIWSTTPSAKIPKSHIFHARRPTRGCCIQQFCGASGSFHFDCHHQLQYCHLVTRSGSLAWAAVVLII